MAREEQLKNQMKLCLEKRFEICEKLQLIKYEKQNIIANPKVFYMLIASVIFALLSLIMLIPTFGSVNALTKSCLIVGGAGTTMASVVCLVNLIKNYKSISMQTKQSNLKQKNEYEDLLQSLNDQINKIKLELASIDNRIDNGNSKTIDDNMHSSDHINDVNFHNIDDTNFYHN